MLKIRTVPIVPHTWTVVSLFRYIFCKRAALRSLGARAALRLWRDVSVARGTSPGARAAQRRKRCLGSARWCGAAAPRRSGRMLRAAGRGAVLPNACGGIFGRRYFFAPKYAKIRNRLHVGAPAFRAWCAQLA